MWHFWEQEDPLWGGHASLHVRCSGWMTCGVAGMCMVTTQGCCRCRMQRCTLTVGNISGVVCALLTVWACDEWCRCQLLYRCM